MLINVQYEAAEKLLWDLLGAVPLDRQAEFAERVNRAASDLVHPNSDGAVLFSFGGNGALQTTTEVIHSSAAECDESALTPKRPGFAAAELPEHEYGLLHVGQPHSAFHETEDDRKNRLSAQCIAQSSVRLLQGS